MNQSFALVFLTILVAFPGPVFAQETLHFSLKDFSTSNPNLRLVQGNQSVSKPDGEGLVFELPAGRKAPNLDGVVAKFDIRGDFEITLSYDQLSLMGTPSPMNSSVAIWLSLNSEPMFGAAVSRSYRPEGSRFVANKITFEKVGEKREERYFPIMKDAPSDLTAGKLRIARKGSTVTHWVSSGLDKEFDLLRTWEIGTGDVTTMRIQVNPGGLDRGLKARLLDLDITAEAFISKANGQSLKKTANSSSIPQLDSAPSPEKPRVPLWVWILIPGLALFSGGLIFAWFSFSRKKSAQE